MLSWDGVPRLDTLFIDYLGAADTPYTRAVTRKAFTAAVARVMRPGVKYDTMKIAGVFKQIGAALSQYVEDLLILLGLFFIVYTTFTVEIGRASCRERV